MNRTLLAGLAGLALALGGTASASAATVSVRVEGQNATLLPRTAITQPADTRYGCSPDSASAALDVATNGNWDHSAFIQTILGETHDYSNSDSWQVWVFRGGSYVSTSVGACDEKLAPGEEALFGYEVSDGNYAPTILPIWITGVPATAAPGRAVTVTVNRTSCTEPYCSTSVAAPLAGATVTGGTAPVTTGADGKATVTLSSRGAAALRATKAGFTPSATETSCVTDGADGYCGTTTPSGTTLPPSVGGSPVPVPGNAPAVKDTSAPQAAITNIDEGQRFRRRKAPRRLEATVSDPSGILQVKLSLTRRVGRHCSYFSGRYERFRRTRCGTRHPFKLGDRGDVSFLLPKRPGKGRYVFDVLATDKAYNRDTLARGRNRVVFTVR